MKRLARSVVSEWGVGPLLLLAAAPSMAAEAPRIATACNSPGWITVYYEHPGDDGAIAYYIERQDVGVTFSMAAPSGQITDANLKSDTEYAYRACAVYQGETSATCSSFVKQRTTSAPGSPTALDPPFINDVTLDAGRIAISWGPTGDYSKVLLRLDDARGNLGQWEAATRPHGYGSFTFQPLQPNTTYHVILKGCSWGALGSSCGPWSQRYTFTTHGPPPPPPPPLPPTLTISGATATTVSIAWTVKVVGSYPGDRVVLVRDNAPYRQLEAHSWSGGLQGDFTDTVSARHTFQVCFERAEFDQRACSDRVTDPLLRSRSEAEIVAGYTKRLRQRREAEEPGVSVAAPPPLSGNAIRAMGASAVSPAAFCAAYADEAVAAAAENVARNCGGAGGRWTSDRQRHIDWCMGLGGDRTVPTAEADARAATLRACRASR